MNNSSLVSIIVPVYGVEAYLAECVDSLLAQTYQNLEILLVDDGSPDNCPAICDAYADRDARIKVIHKENGGAASARNAGLDAMHGEYVCFVDGDDLVCADYVEKLLSTLETAQADISICGFTQMSVDNEVKFLDREPAGSYSCTNYLREFLKHWTCALLWNKLFCKEVICGLRMEEGHRIDDEFFTYQAVLNSQRITVFDAPLYRYRIRTSSVMQEFNTNREQFLLDRIDYTQQRYHKVVEAFPSLQSAFFYDMADSFVRYWLSCRNMPTAEHRIRQWAMTNFRTILTSDMTIKQKMIFISALFLRRAGSADVQSPVRSTINCFP